MRIVKCLYSLWTLGNRTYCEISWALSVGLDLINQRFDPLRSANLVLGVAFDTKAAQLVICRLSFVAHVTEHVANSFRSRTFCMLKKALDNLLVGPALDRVSMNLWTAILAFPCPVQGCVIGPAYRTTPFDFFRTVTKLPGEAQKFLWAAAHGE